MAFPGHVGLPVLARIPPPPDLVALPVAAEDQVRISVAVDVADRSAGFDRQEVLLDHVAVPSASWSGGTTPGPAPSRGRRARSRSVRPCRDPPPPRPSAAGRWWARANRRGGCSGAANAGRTPRPCRTGPHCHLARRHTDADRSRLRQLPRERGASIGSRPWQPRIASRGGIGLWCLQMMFASSSVLPNHSS